MSRRDLQRRRLQRTAVVLDFAKVDAHLAEGRTPNDVLQSSEDGRLSMPNERCMARSFSVVLSGTMSVPIRPLLYRVDAGPQGWLMSSVSALK